MTLETLENRLNAMEAELAQLKQQLQTSKLQETKPSWKQIIGVFKDDPLFDEAERLGQEWRNSQREEYDNDANPSA